MKSLPGLWFALVAVFWLWMDFVGLLLSVISTPFYFGWAGTRLLTVWLFLIALFAFSGPTWYRLLLSRRSSRWLVPVLCALPCLLTLLLVSVRHRQVFAWTVVLGACLSSLAAVAILQRIERFPSALAPLQALTFGGLGYLLSRVLNHGLAPLFQIHWVPLVALVAVGAAGAFLPHEQTAQEGAEQARPEEQEGEQSVGLWLQLYALVFGPLVGLAVGMLYNLSIWSAKTPSFDAGVYLLSFGVGSVFGTAVVTVALRAFWSRLLALALGAGAVGFSLFHVLRVDYSLGMGLLALGVGCFGLALFWGLFLHRWWLFRRANKALLPTIGLQLGMAGFLLILLFFMLFSNPKGFWVGLGACFAVMALIELRFRAAPVQKTSFSRADLALAVVFVLLLLPGGLSIETSLQSESQTPPTNASKKTFSVMSTNIRYGWTDDYRFMPLKHLQWLSSHKADIIGFQEVNKGHTSGAYMDLFALYRSKLPGQWLYGDANFGFGNALVSSFPVKASRLLRYKDRDMLRRSCLWSLLEIHGKEVEIFVTHVSHRKPPNPSRVQQLRQLIGWLKATQRPWIALGDFNARPDSPEVRPFVALAHPVFRQQKALLKAFSFSSLKPRKRIDYIFFSKHFTFQSHKILDNKGSSDHKPIRVVLGL